MGDAACCAFNFVLLINKFTLFSFVSAMAEVSALVSPALGSGKFFLRPGSLGFG